MYSSVIFQNFRLGFLPDNCLHIIVSMLWHRNECGYCTLQDCYIYMAVLRNQGEGRCILKFIYEIDYIHIYKVISLQT